MISSKELKRRVELDGAYPTAMKLKESLDLGHITYKDFSIKSLWENFLVTKANPKEVGIGAHYLREDSFEIKESGSALAMETDGFDLVTSQVFFNALTTWYDSPDFTVSKLFRVIPSTVYSGDKFGGISQIGELLQPIGETDEPPHAKPNQDKVQGPAQQRFAHILDISKPMVAADRTGEVMFMFESLGENMGIQRELEAVSTLTGIDATKSNNSAYTRTQYNWLGNRYATYNTTSSGLATWVNQAVAPLNGDSGVASLNTLWTLLAKITDPLRQNFPVVTPPGPWSLIVPVDLYFNAVRLKKLLEYRSGTASSNDAIEITAGGFPLVEWNPVQSKWLNYAISQNSSLHTGDWYFGNMSAAFSWQRALDLSRFEAIPGAGYMFTRSLAASYKVEKWETSFAFNPRYAAKATAS